MLLEGAVGAEAEDQLLRRNVKRSRGGLVFKAHVLLYHSRVIQKKNLGLLEGSVNHPTPYTLHPTPYTLHPTPYTLHTSPYTLHPTPYTLHPTPYTLHPTPYMGTQSKGSCRPALR